MKQFYINAKYLLVLFMINFYPKIMIHLFSIKYIFQQKLVINFL